MIEWFMDSPLPLHDRLDRLAEHFAQREAEVLAFVAEDGRFERLHRDAEALLARYPDPEQRPPLFGLPIGVKDIFNVDGLPTRAGTTLPPELFAGPEAAAVTALKAAGTLILGKTVTTQFAYFAPGPTRHPRSAMIGTDHTPGGSSSGSAAAVAAGISALTLGTQTIGSVIRPAAYCGVVGFKPTYNRISTAGVWPLAPSADTVGHFTLSLANAILAASILIPDWQSELLTAATTATPVLGIPEGPYLARASAEGLVHFQKTANRLTAAGLTVKIIPAMADFDEIDRRHNLLVAAEAAHTHAALFAAYRDEYHPKTAELITRGQMVSSVDHQQALDGRAQLRDELHALMDQHGIDVWICPPAVGAAPPTLESTGDPVMDLPWTHAGMPCLSLPTGHNSLSLPLGLQLVGRFGADEALLAAAQVVATSLAR